GIQPRAGHQGAVADRSPVLKLRKVPDAMTPDERAYYSTHGKISDPGERPALLSALPSDPERLVAAVSTLIWHRLFVAPLGVAPHPGSADDVPSRTISVIPDRIPPPHPPPPHPPTPPRP